MRIGIFDPYLDDLGGGEKYMMTIAQCLSTAHDVSVFWDNSDDVATVEQRFSLDLSKIKRVPNIFAPGVSTMTRLAQTKKFDMIIVLSDGSVPMTLSKKLLVHVQQPLAQFQNNSWKDKWKLSRVDTFFCNSEYTKKFIAKKFHIKTVVVYPPVALFPKDMEKENSILHVGRFRVKNVSIDDYKKQGVMVQAFMEMVDKGLKNWKFVVATSVQEKDQKAFEQMKKDAEGYPIEFVVNCSNRKLWDVYNKAKLYWHASGFGEDLRKHPEFAEHFGISTVEAMGAGAVPVVINAGGQTEIITEGQTGYLWDSLEELQVKTLRLIHDEKEREAMAQKAQIRAKDFSQEQFIRSIYELITA